MSYDVLLVDDSAVMRRMILRTLQLTGIPLGAVHEAADGAAGLALFAAQRVDLALVDINMPVMDGAELIARLRADERGAALPILVVSTESSSTRIAELERHGARFVHKPFTPERLCAAIRDITGASDAYGTVWPAEAGGAGDF